VIFKTVLALHKKQNLTTNEPDDTDLQVQNDLTELF